MLGRRQPPAAPGPRILALGHSTRSLDELVDLLRGHGVALLADIRSFPRSRTNPQFNRETLAAALPRRGIRYVHLPRLGGRRRGLGRDSPNTGWRNAAFRGYADYLATPEFAAGLDELLALARAGTVAMMCSEAVPWRCHRSLVADALFARGEAVGHVTGPGPARLHRPTPFARFDGGRVTYPPEPAGAAGAPAPRVPVPRAPAPLSPAVAGPLHLEATVRVLQRRPTNPVDRWDGARHRRLLADGDRLVLVATSNAGTVDAPRVRVAVEGIADRPRRRPREPLALRRAAAADLDAAARRRLAGTVARILGLAVDPTPFEARAIDEPRLAPVAAALHGLHAPRYPGLFEAFANVIPFQQVSLDAGAAIVRKLALRFALAATSPDLPEPVHLFPEPSAIAAAGPGELESCGLSARKADALRRIARLVADGALDAETLAAAPLDEALASLVALPGIGPWSAGLLLLRGLGRLDSFPSGDVGVARGLAALAGTAGTPEAASAYAARFGPHRGLLYFYTLAAKLLGAGLIRSAVPATASAPGTAAGPPAPGARRTTTRPGAPPPRAPPAPRTGGSRRGSPRAASRPGSARRPPG
jgi:3-methyladenine DNA glycosylase/8-oxoguanine DNA glycosylase